MASRSILTQGGGTRLDPLGLGSGFFIPCLDLRPGVEVLLVPALKDFIHIGPLQSPGVEAGLLIGHLKGLGIEIHIQPGLGIPVLPPGSGSARRFGSSFIRLAVRVYRAFWACI